MPPIIVNLDGAFDWTAEVRQVWDQLDLEQIRQAIAPQIPSEEWLGRRDELSLIGLVSSLRVEHAYRLPAWEDSDVPEDERDEPLSRDWRDRQLGQNTNRPHFNGEEPFFRSPRVGRRGVVECYGIYVDDAAKLLDYWGFRNEGLLAKRGLPRILLEPGYPAIFLSPERLYGIYPTIISLGKNLQQPLLLSSNPALVNLRMTLLHELGPHFFPVQGAGAGQFLSEALANLFCKAALNQEEETWLLYKSWHLQPPEYSAYRPLGVLCDGDADCHAATASCFSGTLDGWASLPKKAPWGLEHAIGASVNMALAADAAACTGLWQRGLQQVVSKENRWMLGWDSGNLHFHIHRHRSGHIPADLVLDLYRKNDLTPWVTNAAVPERFWERWGYSGSPEVQWPEDCISLPSLGTCFGKVKKLLKNYGFIADDEDAAKVWFFHKMNVSSPTFEALAVGDAVRFTLTESTSWKHAGEKQAAEVRRVERWRHVETDR